MDEGSPCYHYLLATAVCSGKLRQPTQPLGLFRSNYLISLVAGARYRRQEWPFDGDWWQPDGRVVGQFE
jgi:hypothetical protein